MHKTKQRHFVLCSTADRRRALQLAKRAITEIQDGVGIRDIEDYTASKEFAWRYWPDSTGKEVEEPQSNFAVFKDETANDVILFIQFNHETGATWHEIRMLPLAIQYLRLWKTRIRQKDASQLFNITDRRLRATTIDEFVLRQLRQSVMLFASLTSEYFNRVKYDSLFGLIEQTIKPHFEPHWRSIGIDMKSFELFPQLKEQELKFFRQSQSLRNKWLVKKHGGSRNVSSFAYHPEFISVIAFIDLVRPLWVYVIQYFAKNAFHHDCALRIKLEVQYKQLMRGLYVSDRLLNRVFHRANSLETGKTSKKLQPLGFAIEHAKEDLLIRASHDTIRRHYDHMKQVEKQFWAAHRTNSKTT